MTWYDLSVFYFKNQDELKYNPNRFTISDTQKEFVQKFNGKGFIDYIQYDFHTDENATVSVNLDGKKIDIISYNAGNISTTIANFFGANAGYHYYDETVFLNGKIFYTKKLNSAYRYIFTFTPFIFNEEFEIVVTKQNPARENSLIINYFTMK